MSTIASLNKKNMRRGTLYLVVGPSGAGKDSLIDGAKSVLVGDERYVFPRRYITRPAEAGGENHIPVSSDLFDFMLKNGEMLLHWDAHGLRYGVSMSVEIDLRLGRNVILNVSRTVVDMARSSLAPIKVLYVTVSDDVLAERLRGRGREDESDIARRVARAQEYRLEGSDVHEIDNGGSLSQGISAFLEAIGSKIST